MTPRDLSVDPNPTPVTAAATHITNPTLLNIVRMLWLLFFVSNIGYYLFYTLPTAAQIEICESPIVQCFPLVPRLVADQLTTWNIDYHLVAWEFIIGDFLVNCLFGGIALLLFWKRSDEVMALMLGALLMGAEFGLPFVALRIANTILVALFLFLFPTGHFAPRWTRWVILGFILVATGALIIPALFSLMEAVLTPLMFVALGTQIYRYRRVYSPTQRQQVKWVLLGLSAPIIFFPLIYAVPLNALINSGDAALITVFYVIVGGLIGFIPIAFFAITIVFSITRYRLWDIDLVINRSLVYTAVTALLALVFAGIIGLVSALTQGQGQVVGVALAAVAAGSLFNPARKTIQGFVDHRIYRLRYDLNEVAAAQKKPDVKNPGHYTGRTFGSYEVLGVLGKGGMGEVYKGFGDNRTVALKVLPEELARKDEFRTRFTREAQTLASLEHPNIVRLYGSGLSDDGVHYLAMEYIDGQELSTVIEHGALHDHDALREWITSIASALDYIHSKGLVHRDLKPSNIMLRPSTADTEIKEAVLMDFGIARVNVTGTRITGSGAIGTIDYMSPEQIMAAREVDGRSDVYALGIIVYELLTGERPFKGSAGQVLFAHIQQPAPDPRDLNPEVPRAAAHALQKALAKKPEDRFTSAGEFAAALAP
ncbi:MAG: serine/threonine-protein kinase [Anaerolineae bacterium]